MSPTIIKEPKGRHFIFSRDSNILLIDLNWEQFNKF